MAQPILVQAIYAMPYKSFERAVGDYLMASQLAGRWIGQRRVAARRKKIADDKTTQQNLEAFAAPFREAIDALVERLQLDPDTFLTLDRAARSRAGRIAGEFNLRIVQDAYDTLTQTLADGGTVRDFRLALEKLPQTDGWTGENPWHANLVFRQNAAMAFASGNFSLLADADVHYWTFRVYGDSCTICAPMADQTFSMQARRYYPPLHFGCDCYADPAFDHEIAEINASGKLVTGNSFDNPEYEAALTRPGAFTYDPASFARLEPFNIAKLPVHLRSAFADYAKRHNWETVG